MRLIGIESLSPGDTLAMPLYTTSGKIVLNAGAVMDQNYISKVKNLGVRKIYICDPRFDDIEISDALDIKLMNEATQVLKDNRENIFKDKEVDEYSIKEIGKKIVEYVRDSKAKGVSILSTSAVDDFIIGHSINVAILSTFICNKLSFNYSQVCDLVTGALIHDIGRENKKEEDEEHINKGFNAFRKCRGLTLNASKVCYEHHENFDGTGYPRKLKGKDISDYSRVVRVADFYDNALQGYESNDAPLMPHQAYECILAASGMILDPDVVEVFRDAIIFYPNGCTVLLSNGLKGVVIKQNPGSPQRPIVRIFNATSVIGEINLLKSLTLDIKEVLVA